MELSSYELKQGIVSLGDKREINIDLLERIVQTICAIANNGPLRSGKIMIGVADSDQDVSRIIKLDKVQPRAVGEKHVVGINREAAALGITLENYYALLRQSIAGSGLSEPLKSAVLSSIDFNSYFGLGVIVITVPEQREPSFVGELMYWRDGDNTRVADSAKLISDIGRRF